VLQSAPRSEEGGDYQNKMLEIGRLEGTKIFISGNWSKKGVEKNPASMRVPGFLKLKQERRWLLNPNFRRTVREPI